MKKTFFLPLLLFAFTGCVANKTVTDGGDLLPPGVKFLNADEINKSLAGKTIAWTQLSDKKKGETIYSADGRIFREDGTWKVTEDGHKCQKTKRGTWCQRISKRGDKYIGVADDGKELYEFTANTILNGDVVAIAQTQGTYLTPEEVTRLYSGNITTYKSLVKDYSGQTAYYEDGTRAGVKGTWSVGDDGVRCLKWNSGKEYCGKIFKIGSIYYVTEDDTKALISYVVKE